MQRVIERIRQEFVFVVALGNVRGKGHEQHRLAFLPRQVNDARQVSAKRGRGFDITAVRDPFRPDADTVGEFQRMIIQYII